MEATENLLEYNEIPIKYLENIILIKDKEVD